MRVVISLKVKKKITFRMSYRKIVKHPMIKIRK